MERGFVGAGYLIGLAVIGAALWVAYDTVDSRGYARGKADCEKAVQLEKEEQLGRENLAATEVAKGDAKARIVYRRIERTVDKYIDRPVYRNVCLDADGLRDANAALAGPEDGAGSSAPTLPGPDAPRRRPGEDGLAEAGGGR